jgi:hypothetical protein
MDIIQEELGLSSVYLVAGVFVLGMLFYLLAHLTV